MLPGGRPAGEPDENRPVRLISLTPGAEELILFCARVSSDQENTDVGLIRYLIRKKHWSPFEMAHAVVEFKTSRAMGRELLRHKSFSFQEFSQRYSKPPGTVKYRARRQAEKNRQSSIDDLPEEIQRFWQALQTNNADHAFRMYETALKAGVARECARILLPEGTETKIYMAGTLRSWIHFFEQRCAEDAQQEIQDLAYEARGLMGAELPTIREALLWA